MPRRGLRGTARWIAATTVANSLLISCTLAVAQQQPELDSKVQQAIAEYMRDQNTGRAALLALTRDRRAEPPPPVRLFVADAFIRGGDMGSARRILRGVLAGNDGAPYTAWADLMLGWMAFTGGRYVEARAHYQSVAQWELARDLVPVVLGLIDAADGHYTAATNALTVATSKNTPSEIRVLARMGVGYAQYWAGDFDAAAGTFDAIAMQEPASVFLDDATFGSAWSRWRMGNDERAFAKLEAVVGNASEAVDPQNPSYASLGLVNLEPRAFLRAAMKRYRRVLVERPNDQLVRAFNMDTQDLAESALFRIDEGLTPQALVEREKRTRKAPRSDAAPLAPPSAPRSAGGDAPADRSTGWGLYALVIVAVSVVIATTARLARRGRT